MILVATELYVCLRSARVLFWCKRVENIRSLVIDIKQISSATFMSLV